MAVSVDEVFDSIVEESVDKRQQGTKWERAVQWFLTQDPAWRDRFDHVWMWDDAPTNPDRQDTGIDLVAQDMDGEYWAIQAKCYSNTLSDKDVSTFFMASMADTRYRHFIIADTAPAISLARVADHARLGRQGLPMSMQPTQI
ncbi:MAG: restriction endonuclease [Bifidobacterium dentium]